MTSINILVFCKENIQKWVCIDIGELQMHKNIHWHITGLSNIIKYVKSQPIKESANAEMFISQCLIRSDPQQCERFI